MDPGIPADPSAVEVAAELGRDLSGHLSMAASAAMIRSTDLVLCMTAVHVRNVIQLESEALLKTCQLRSFVRLANEIGPRHTYESVADWSQRVITARQTEELFSDTDDITDPIGESITVFREVSTLIDRLAFQAVSLAYPRSVLR
jgi:protein-tyrosine-phosphatase